MKKVIISLFFALLLGLTQSQARERTNRETDMVAMTMTTNKYGIVKIILNGNGMATIDWGNGRKTRKFASGRVVFTHHYFNRSSRTITVYGQNITYLDCSGNKLTNLDVSNNAALKTLYCSKNQLTYLDVSQNTALMFLDCSKNQLNNLDVSHNSALINLVCTKNQLTSLDVSRNSALTFVNCRNNQLTAEALNDFFHTLNNAKKEGKILYIRNNHGTFASNQSVATSRWWLIDTSFI